MCKDCYTFAELSDTLKSALGIEGRYIASLTNAWDLANLVVRNDEENDEEKWFTTKEALWKGGDIVIGNHMVQGEDGFPENYWEVYERMNIKGCSIYKIPSVEALGMGCQEPLHHLADTTMN